MKLTELRKQAIVQAQNLPADEVICIYRTAPRKFEMQVGQTPGRDNLVQIIYAGWVQEGWYAKYYPEWMPNNGMNSDRKERRENPS